MNKTIKNLIVFLGTIFAIFIGLFGLAGIYTSAIEGNNNYAGDWIYFLTFGLICLTIASFSLYLSVKLHYHR